MPNTPTPIAPSASAGSAGAGDNSCSTGAIQCCEQVQSANSAGIAALLGVLGVVLQDVNVPIGVTCSPISVVGVGGSDACSANTVCCENNSFGGLISIGCLPVEL